MEKHWYYYEVGNAHKGQVVAISEDEALNILSTRWNISKDKIQVQVKERYHGK